jgi:hypothetical protein
LGCSDHAGESVPPDPMRTGSSRVAHGNFLGQKSRFVSYTFVKLILKLEHSLLHVLRC